MRSLQQADMLLSICLLCKSNRVSLDIFHLKIILHKKVPKWQLAKDEVGPLISFTSSKEKETKGEGHF